MSQDMRCRVPFGARLCRPRPAAARWSSDATAGLRHRRARFLGRMWPVDGLALQGQALAAQALPPGAGPASQLCQVFENFFILLSSRAPVAIARRATLDKLQR